MVYTLGAAVAMTTMCSPSVARLVPTTIGLVVLLAGYVQLTPWKARELACCRTPPLAVALSVRHLSAWQHGVKLGLHCSLCCASLMGVLLALGIMDLGVMTLVGAAIAFERITPWPVSTARVVGLGALAIGMVVVARALFAGHLVT
jgi:predicted metal-binding membrane protein